MSVETLTTTEAAIAEAPLRPRGLSAGAKTLLSLLVIHSLLDCYAGIWPIYKHIAGIPLAAAGFIASVTTISTWALQPMFGVWADRGYLRACVLGGTALTFPMMLLGPLGLQIDRVGIAASYAGMFLILLLAKLGQAAYHPAGATMAGNTGVGRRSTMVSLFVAFGWMGYGSSQALFSITHRVTGGHTEVLLIPGAIILAWAIVWCRPVEAAVSTRSGLIDSLKRIPFGQHRLGVLFVMLALMSALGQGLFFLLPEFMEARGYPMWTVRGGALIWFVSGAALGLAPAGYLADRFGRRRMLIATTLLSAASFYATILAPQLPIPLFAVMCFATGALMNMANPIGVALGQERFPNESSLISGVLMGLAWALGALAPWTVGQLASQPSVGIVGALAALGGANVLAFMLTLALVEHANE
jgi:MFS transporter, FSR family, fosmidomycin resistance protein